MFSGIALSAWVWASKEDRQKETLTAANFETNSDGSGVGVGTEYSVSLIFGKLSVKIGHSIVVCFIYKSQLCNLMRF